MTDLSTTAGSRNLRASCRNASRRRPRAAAIRAGLLLALLAPAASGQPDPLDSPSVPAEQAAQPKHASGSHRSKASHTRDRDSHDKDSSKRDGADEASAKTTVPKDASDDRADASGAEIGQAGAPATATQASGIDPNLGAAGSTSVSTGPSGPAPAASVPAAEYDLADVKVRDSVVLRLKLADGGLVPQERARRAIRAIEAALAEGKAISVRTELRQDRAMLFIGERPIIELTRTDAEVVGEGSLEMFAASAAAKIGDLLETERQRSIVAHNAFNVALVIMLGVAALYALRLLGALARRIREFVRMNPDRIPAIRLRSIEVIGPHVLRSGIVVGLGVLKLLLQLTLIFAWLLFSSSMFDATRGMTGQLTALVLAPLSGLATRFVALMPVLLLTTIGVVALVVLLRFVSLFFAGVERRETELTWLRPELAAPTSLLIRIALVVVSLLLLAPLLTGNTDGSLARVGMLSVTAIALATTPFLANIVVGLVTLYGDRLTMGDEIRIGAHAGRLVSVDLVELHLRTANGNELRIPHLVTIVHPIVVSNAPARSSRRLTVTAETSVERLMEVLTANQALGDLATLEISRLESKVVTVELTPKESGLTTEQRMLVEVAKLLESNQLRLILAEWRPHG